MTVKYLFIISMIVTVEGWRRKNLDIASSRKVKNKTRNTREFSVSESIEKFSQVLFQELNIGTSLLLR